MNKTQGKMFFTSDLHFADPETLEEDNRPFKSVEQYDKYMIKQINKTAKKSDTIYVVGDYMDSYEDENIYWKKALSYLKKIKADVVLIIGNNEERIMKKYFNNKFDEFALYCKSQGMKEVYKSLIVEVAGHKFNLVHKISKCKKNMLNLFGHCHLNCGVYHPFGFNMSCNLNSFRLYSEDDIEWLLYKKYNHWDKDVDGNYLYKK